MTTKALPEIPGWKVKLVQRNKHQGYGERVPRLELRQRIQECDVLLAVQEIGGWVHQSGSHSWHSKHECQVKLSVNGPLWLEPGDLVAIDNAARLALAWFEGIDA